MKQIVIRKKDISLLEDGELIENYKLDNSKYELEGNIYCGVVRNILPSMQSAFIDIGENKNAFIHIKDILPIENNQTGTKNENYEHCKITDLIKKNSPILVQVKKNEEIKKGARVSAHISLTGRYAVLMPGIDFITVSQKITDQKEKDRIIKIADNYLKNKIKSSEKFSLILRTVTEGASKEEIENDIKLLIDKYNCLLSAYNNVSKNNKPVKLFDNSDVIYKTLIGVIDDKETEIFVDAKVRENKVKKILKEIDREDISIIVEKENIKDMFELNEQIKKACERKIWLKCGGFITIDHTEALTAIDVNSGKYTGKKNNSKDDVIYTVNKEATIEIAKQLRLRNTSGIIIIDYIDMSNDNERKKVYDLMEKESKKDRSKVQLIEFTKLDLLEITRKRL